MTQAFTNFTSFPCDFSYLINPGFSLSMVQKCSSKTHSHYSYHIAELELNGLFAVHGAVHRNIFLLQNQLDTSIY